MVDPLMMQGQAQGMAPAPMPPDPGMLPADPSADPGLDPATEPEPPVGSGVEPAPEPEPVDPLSAAIDEILYLDPQEAIRRVYQIAVSAARAQAKVDAAGERLDVQQYHAIASGAPEVRYARELGAARRRLDTLAGERRRLSLELGRQHDAGRGSGVLAAQLAATDMAMGQVAKGVLLFLSLPSPDLLETQNGE